MGLIVWIPTLGIFSLIHYFVISYFNILIFIITTTVCFSVLWIISLIWFRTGYFVDEEKLVIKLGPITVNRIPINKLYYAERSRTLLASSANSLKHLMIFYDGGQVAISPKEKNEFLDLIKKINPNFK